MDSHAGRMDAIYRTQRHFYDLTRKYYLLGRDGLIRTLAPPPGGTVLEIGCGTGRNLIAAARAWPEARLYGIDISEAMLETARAKVARAGLSGRITLARGDATGFDAAALFGVATFDRVFQSYTLSMIPDWQGAIREGAAKLAPGGELAVVDFGQQERLPRWWRGMLFAWLARFDVAPRALLPDALREVALDAGLRVELAARYRGYAWAGRLVPA
ncbi:MAG: class I SAM-dependent methyltransferase [Sphingomonas sp.]|jgi:S-adenosylmethionine-diacylgycerolhomoserine-N-methlytransferase|uniref:class I SAM-dependent methyltransferase n=1 Tax=Sphingomonas sp. TaxID=28214 RepID=UPI0035630085